MVGILLPQTGQVCGVDKQPGMSKVLAKEVAPFNVRVLTVSLGTFNTNMIHAVTLGKNPMPEDYKGSVAETMMVVLSSGKFNPDSDKEKAMKAVYEVVVGEGVGAGREGEKFLPLGRDLAARVKQVQDQFAHSMEVFGDICNNVYIDK
jgi:NAD(P)-dependent dehydrogenase (short-subunit alcohol dehydrogenase family)